MSSSSQQLSSGDQSATNRGLDPMSCDVLVIEDDEDCRDMLCYLLGSEGYRVLAVASGADALTTLAKMASAPRLILLDLIMPGMNGIDCLLIMRRTPAFTSIPVIVHSGCSLPAEGGALLGIVRWLQKPVRAEVLLEVARELTR